MFDPRQKAKKLHPSEAVLQETADLVNVELPALKAVIEVESDNRFYNKDGTLIMRFEPHKLAPELKRKIRWRGGFAQSLALTERRRGILFAKAFAISPEGALRATSMGGFQIMGFNARHCGFKSAIDMAEKFVKDVDFQVAAFMAYVLKTDAATHLRAHNWYEFAVVYNGPARAKYYAKKIATAYAKLTGKRTYRVLRRGSKGPSVSKLQTTLRWLGYDVGVDGDFGNQTYLAVKAFQEDNDLVPDGIVGAKTWSVLLESTPPRPEPEPMATEREDLLKTLSGASGALSGVSGLVASLVNGAGDTVRLALILMAGGFAAYAFYTWRKSKKYVEPWQ